MSSVASSCPIKRRALPIARHLTTTSFQRKIVADPPHAPLGDGQIRQDVLEHDLDQARGAGIGNLTVAADGVILRCLAAGVHHHRLAQVLVVPLLRLLLLEELLELEFGLNSAVR